MKTNLLFLTLAFIYGISSAQLVTITETNQMPQIGDTIRYIDANTFGFAVDGVGPVTDKLWDFAALMDAGTTIDFWYEDATTTAQTASYPNANLARANTAATGYDYYETTGTQINRWGMYSDPANWIINNEPATEFQFPITAGGSYNSAYTGDMSPYGVGEDSVRIEQGQIIVSADMQGTLILPNGTYTNVLRLHLIESFHIKAYMLGTPIMDNLVEDDYYYWFVDNKLGAVLIYGTTSLDGSQTSEVLRYQEACDFFFPENNNICQGNTYLWQGITCDTAGTYYANYTTTSGCDSIYELVLTVNSPVVDLGVDSIMCDYENIILDAGAGYSNYQWSTGGVSQTENIDSTGTGLGSISVSVLVTDTSGCTNADTVTITFENCTNIPDITNELIKVYPNPTNRTVFISGGEFEYIELYNMLGEKLFTTKNNEIDLTEFSESIFILSIQTKQKKIVKRIILTR